MLEITLFGYPRFLHDGHELTISRKKAIAVFAYLTLTKARHARDSLATFFWPDHEMSHARAELRRILYTLNKSPLATLIVNDNGVLSVQGTDEQLRVDVWECHEALELKDWGRILDNVAAWKRPILEGFSLQDETGFDLWRTQVETQQHYALINQLQQMANRAMLHHQYAKAVAPLQALIDLDMEHEDYHRQLMLCYVQQKQPQSALRHYELLQQFLATSAGTPEDETIALAEAIKAGHSSLTLAHKKGNLPALPDMLVGRDALLADIKTRLTSHETFTQMVTLILQGVPGVGKTTLSAHLAHDYMLHQHFPDGVLWTSLGQSPHILGILQEWGAALSIDQVAQAKDSQRASTMLRNHLTAARVLIIIDDIWDAQHLLPFKIGGDQSATLLTTRLNNVAQAIATRPEQLIKVPILAQAASFELLRTIIPQIVADYPAEIGALIDDLEGLPLSLQVAARLLRDESQYGWQVHHLLESLREGKRLLGAAAPLDRQVAGPVIPLSVAALLQLSTNHLDELTRQRFARLGVFAPKPALFEIEAVGAVWQTDNPRPTIRQLVSYGLLDVVPPNHLQMHALLVHYARSMFQPPKSP